MTLIISQYHIQTNMTMHVIFDHVRSFFLYYVEEDSENLTMYVAEMVWPYL